MQNFKTKNLKLILLALITLSLNFSSYARIHEIKKIAEVAKYVKAKPSVRNLGNLIKEKVFAIFDIDNTLLHPDKKLDSAGSDQWFSDRVKTEMNKGESINNALDKVLPLYYHIAQNINLELVEATLVKDIKNIEKLCEHTICLTARSLCLADITAKQLDRNNLYFKVPEIKTDELKLNLPNESLYKHGILFCGNNSKGLVVTTLLDAMHYTPEKVVFVDDKEHNLKAVEKAVEARGIKFIGLRYSGCDEKVKNFNKEKADKKLEELLERCPFSG